MTENHNTMLELDQYRKRYLYALKAAHVCVFEVDLKRQLYTFFENAEDIFGVPGDCILEASFRLTSIKKRSPNIFHIPMTGK